MVNYRPCAIVYAGEARKRGNYITEAEGLRYCHYRTEQKLLLHVRKGDIPELLPAVADAVHRACFVLRFVDGLKTADKCKECSTERCPQGNDYTERHNVFFVLEELNRRCFNAVTEQQVVDIAVGVAVECNLPYKVYTAGDRGCVEDQSYNSSYLRRQLVYEPRRYKRKQIGNGSCDYRKYKRVLNCRKEYIVVKEETKIVFDKDEFRVFDKVEHRKAVIYRKDNGTDRERKEYKEIRQRHDISVIIALYFLPCPLQLRHILARYGSAHGFYGRFGIVRHIPVFSFSCSLDLTFFCLIIFSVAIG